VSEWSIGNQARPRDTGHLIVEEALTQLGICVSVSYTKYTNMFGDGMHLLTSIYLFKSIILSSVVLYSGLCLQVT